MMNMCYVLQFRFALLGPNRFHRSPESVANLGMKVRATLEGAPSYSSRRSSV